MPGTRDKELPLVHIRLQEPFHSRIKDAAYQRGVTQTAEINRRLSESFNRDPIISLQADVRRLLKLHERS
jgi:hypothetical protein